VTFSTSLDAPALATLLDEWLALQATPVSPARNQAIKSLAHRFVAHRAKLFVANAQLQADAPSDDDAAMVAQIAANQNAIKACTNALSEMVALLGHAEIPA
jgi:hypothetical protein